MVSHQRAVQAVLNAPRIKTSRSRLVNIRTRSEAGHKRYPLLRIGASMELRIAVLGMHFVLGLHSKYPMMNHLGTVGGKSLRFRM